MTVKLMKTTALLFAAVLSFAFIQPKPWVVPDNFKHMKNPVAANAESVSAGKALWQQHCSSCHGKTGLGDGNKAAQLKTQPPDLTKADFQEQTDGAMFYKISEGRDDMPSFKKKIPDQEDTWSLVNFMRTLKK
ncbi:MAG TPA: c-type cytochrome [Chitinophagaceae bacterium]|jgi:mono/diheme cytochrome c family protein|nr:c-type cytochrome [Chitinophagaceae bacterium]